LRLPDELTQHAVTRKNPRLLNDEEVAEVIEWIGNGLLGRDAVIATP
jgi:hypothetical protein